MIQKILLLLLFLVSFSLIGSARPIELHTFHLKNGETIRTKGGLEVTFKGGGQTFDSIGREMSVRFIFRYQNKESVQVVMIEKREMQDTFGFKWKLVEAAGSDPREVTLEIADDPLQTQTEIIDNPVENQKERRLEQPTPVQETPHLEAMQLFLQTQLKKIQAIENSKEWWIDTKKRDWQVKRPFAPGTVDSTHLFQVEYLIEGKKVCSWSVDTSKKSVQGECTKKP